MKRIFFCLFVAISNLAIAQNKIIIRAQPAGSGGANNFPTSLTFDAATGDLTLGRSGLSALVENLDGRYLTSFTETDPVFTASAAAGITGTNITNWNTAFGWGNHALANYLTTTTGDARYYTKTQLQTSGQASVHWDNITNEPAFLTSYTETDPTIPHTADATTNKYLNWNGSAYIRKQVAYSEVSGTPTLSTVATTGAYSDLSGLPNLALYELLSNKATTFGTLNNTLYPSTLAVSNYVTGLGYVTGNIYTTNGTLAGNRTITGSNNYLALTGGRWQEAKGANVAAANNLTLGNDGNTFSITGATQINAITNTNWQAGSKISLIFASTPTVKHNTAGGASTSVILLSGAADYTAAANDVLELVYDGTSWHETARKLATTTGGGRMVYPAAGVAVSTGSAWGTSLSNTTVGTNILTATNPSAIRWIRVNADNTITFRTAAETLADIGAQASGSYLTSITSSTPTNLTGILKGNGSTIGTAVSGTDIKTVNGVSLLGSGDVAISSTNIYNTDGTLTSARTLTQSTNRLTFTSSGTSNTTSNFLVSGTGANGLAMEISSAGRGLLITGSAAGHNPLTVDAQGSGFGTEISSIDGPTLYLHRGPASTNTIVSTLQLSRFSTGTAANGIGQSIDFYNQTSTGSGQLSNQIISTLTDAANATRSSQMEFWGVNNATNALRLAIKSTGQFQAPSYTTTSSFPITAVGLLGFDASGNIGTVAPGGTGTVTNFSAGDLAPLFTTTEATTTTTPALSFALTNAAATTVFGNFTNATAAPSYNAATADGQFLVRRSGALTFGGIVAGDIPTLNQNTTGTAASVTGTNVVTNTNLSQMAANTLKGNNTAGTANAADLTVSQVRTMMGFTTVGTNWTTTANPSAITFPKVNADNSITYESAATHRTSIGGTTVGQNFFTLVNPSAVSYPQINADNTVSTLTASGLRTAIGAGTGSGTVTNFSAGDATGLFTTSEATTTTTPALTFTMNTQTANTVFAGPTSGGVATPGFRSLVAADIPDLSGSYIRNQYTSKQTANSWYDTTNLLRIRTQGFNMQTADALNWIYLPVGRKTDQTQTPFATKQLMISNRQPTETSQDWDYWSTRGGNALLWMQRYFKETENDTASQQYNGMINGVNKYVLDPTSTRFDSTLGRAYQMQNSGVYMVSQLFPTANTVINLSPFGGTGSPMVGNFGFGDAAYNITFNPGTSTPIPATVYQSDLDFNRAAPSSALRMMKGGQGISGYLSHWKSYQSGLGAGVLNTGSVITRVNDFYAKGSLYDDPFSGQGFTKTQILTISRVDTAIGFFSYPKRTNLNEVVNGYGFAQKGTDDLNFFEGRSFFGSAWPQYATASAYPNKTVNVTNGITVSGDTSIIHGLKYYVQDPSGTIHRSWFATQDSVRDFVFRTNGATTGAGDNNGGSLIMRGPKSAATNKGGLEFEFRTDVGGNNSSFQIWRVNGGTFVSKFEQKDPYAYHNSRLIVNGTTDDASTSLQVTGSAKLSALAGFGAGYVAVDNNGLMSWSAGSGGGGGSGTVNSGTQYRLAHYAATGTAVSETSNDLTWNGVELKVALAGSDMGSFTFQNGGSSWFGALINVNGTLQMQEIASPGTPTTGYGRIYIATDGTCHFINDAGTDVDLGATGGGGGMGDPGSNGVLVRTALNTTVSRTITGTTNKIDVTNGTGVSANPTINVGSDIVDKTIANAYTAGTRQMFSPSTTTAGANVAGSSTITSDPSGLLAGDLWFNATAPGTLKYADNTPSVRTVVNTDGTQALTNKTLVGSSNSVEGTFISEQIVTSGVSVTSPAGATKAWVRMVGGGGGGGGSTGAASNAAAAAGGGSGAYCEFVATVTPSTAYTIAIGGGGAGGANTGATGGAGNTTSMVVGATTYTAPGGSGGAGMTSGTTAAISKGGDGAAIATNGTINIGGDPGNPGVRLSGTVAISGVGGTSKLGSGGNPLIASGAGVIAKGYGAGGGGAASVGNSNNAGGGGTSGVIIIHWSR